MNELSDSSLIAFIELIHRHAGITLDMGRKSLVQSRLRPRLRELHLETFEAYLEFLKSEPSETQNFIDLLTTNETYFYRTPRIWEYIRDDFLPRWIAAHPGTIFRVWSGAASSGEEAHTLGVLLQEFRRKNPAFQYQIVGTDICREILERAKQGEYTGRSIEAFRTTQAEVFHRHMVPTSEGSFRASDEIRSRIQFRRHNLFEKPGTENEFDLVLLRNVLIYFSPADQEKVLSHVRMAMKADATLIIGESESLSQIQTPFKYQQPLIYGVAA